LPQKIFCDDKAVTAFNSQENLWKIFFRYCLPWCSLLPVLFRRQPRLIVTMDGITRITTEAITTHIAITGTTICTGAGLSASMGAPDIIAIGNRAVARTALTIRWNRPRSMRGTGGTFKT
jgi:hypothetical protein